MLAMALSGGDYAVIAGLLTAFVGVPSTLIVFSVRGLAQRLEVAESRMQERVDGVQRDVQHLEQRKIDKVDWLSEVVKTRRRLENVGEQLTGISTRLDGAATIGTAINKLAEQLARNAETRHHG